MIYFHLTFDLLVLEVTVEEFISSPLSVVQSISGSTRPIVQSLGLMQVNIVRTVTILGNKT